jgi:hypothetical protein
MTPLAYVDVERIELSHRVEWRDFVMTITKILHSELEIL